MIYLPFTLSSFRHGCGPVQQQVNPLCMYVCDSQYVCTALLVYPECTVATGVGSRSGAIFYLVIVLHGM